MTQKLGCIALVVRDYDEAMRSTRSYSVSSWSRMLTWAAGSAGCECGPPGSNGTDLLLARAVNPEQESRVGNQTGGRVFLFLHTDDFWRDYRAMTGRGVKFVRPPNEESYATVAVFEDLYGNQWDLLQMKD